MKLFKLIRLSGILLSAALSASAATPSGSWRGELDAGPSKLPLVFNFKLDSSGHLRVTMDSPHQNAKGLNMRVSHCSDDSISLKNQFIGATYTAHISEGRIEGTFTQRGYKFPLVLTPEKTLAERRPQTPQPPFPYTTTDTVFASADGILLAGTITVPDGVKKPPIVVMVTGSGPQNRDEEIFEHRPFAVIADYLARHGIASLRYDDRGVAASKGDYASSTVYTFMDDARSALRFAGSLPGFGRTGILGHSEGGTVALMTAPDARPDFIISLAGMATPAKSTLLEQNGRLLDSSGITGEEKEASLQLISLLFDTVRAHSLAGESTAVDIDSICELQHLKVPAAVLESIKNNDRTRGGYLDSLISLDPTDALPKIRCRVLALNGSLDTQVNPDSNLEAISRYVRKSETHRLEGLNHLFQHATTGDVSEYGSISETISPEVLEIIVKFIR